MFQFYKNYMEFFFVVLMLLGVILALSLKSAAAIYIIIFLAGILAGRIVYERKNNIRFPYFVIIGGFVIGYVVFIYYGSRLLVILFFILGSVFGHKLYDKGILKDLRF